VKHPTPSETLTIRPSLRLRTRPLRVLNFDIENRPLSYLGSDFTTAEVTAISWAWHHDPAHVTVHLLGDSDLPAILQAFVAAYNQADLVVGHFIRAHDLPMVNGALMEFGMPALSDKMTHDTKIDLMKFKGLSKSQESLAAMFRLEQPKVHMNQIRWRAANRLTAEGLDYVRERVVGDVQQNIALWQTLIRGGYVWHPVLWRSKSTEPLPTYTA
jgi:hypothetical protein